SPAPASASSTASAERPASKRHTDRGRFLSRGRGLAPFRHATGNSVAMHAIPDTEELLAPDLVDDPNRSAAAEPARATLTARRRRRWGRQASLAALSLGAVGTFLALARVIEGS